MTGEKNIFWEVDSVVFPTRCKLPPGAIECHVKCTCSSVTMQQTHTAATTSRHEAAIFVVETLALLDRLLLATLRTTSPVRPECFDRGTYTFTYSILVSILT
jgi:hypothetical protein